MHVAHMSKALKMQCHAWIHTARMYYSMSIHSVCRDLSIAIIALCHIIININLLLLISKTQ